MYVYDHIPEFSNDLFPNHANTECFVYRVALTKEPI